MVYATLLTVDAEEILREYHRLVRLLSKGGAAGSEESIQIPLDTAIAAIEAALKKATDLRHLNRELNTNKLRKILKIMRNNDGAFGDVNATHLAEHVLRAVADPSYNVGLHFSIDGLV